MPASLAAATSSGVVLSVRYNVINGVKVDLLAAGTASLMRASYSFAYGSKVGTRQVSR